MVLVVPSVCLSTYLSIRLASMFTCQNWHILETILYQLWHILTCHFWPKFPETALLFHRVTN